jgi:hypothetical protein
VPHSIIQDAQDEMSLDIGETIMARAPSPPLLHSGRSRATAAAVLAYSTNDEQTPIHAGCARLITLDEPRN